LRCTVQKKRPPKRQTGGGGVKKKFRKGKLEGGLSGRVGGSIKFSPGGNCPTGREGLKRKTEESETIPRVTDPPVCPREKKKNRRDGEIWKKIENRDGGGVGGQENFSTLSEENCGPEHEKT